MRLCGIIAVFLLLLFRTRGWLQGSISDMLQDSQVAALSGDPQILNRFQVFWEKLRATVLDTTVPQCRAASTATLGS